MTTVPAVELAPNINSWLICQYSHARSKPCTPESKSRESETKGGFINQSRFLSWWTVTYITVIFLGLMCYRDHTRSLIQNSLSSRIGPRTADYSSLPLDFLLLLYPTSKCSLLRSLPSALLLSVFYLLRFIRKLGFSYG